jgi:hypothetical protein
MSSFIYKFITLQKSELGYCIHENGSKRLLSSVCLDSMVVAVLLNVLKLGFSKLAATRCAGIRAHLFAILLVFTIPTWCEPLELKAFVSTDDMGKLKDIGGINVPPLGKVRFTAVKTGVQVIVYATGPDGASLGRAETTVGLSSEPIHIATPSGLKKIEIFWNLSGAK